MSLASSSAALRQRSQQKAQRHQRSSAPGRQRLADNSMTTPTTTLTSDAGAAAASGTTNMTLHSALSRQRVQNAIAVARARKQARDSIDAHAERSRLQSSSSSSQLSPTSGRRSNRQTIQSVQAASFLVRARQQARQAIQETEERRKREKELQQQQEFAQLKRQQQQQQQQQQETATATQTARREHVWSPTSLLSSETETSALLRARDEARRAIDDQQSRTSSRSSPLQTTEQQQQHRNPLSSSNHQSLGGGENHDDNTMVDPSALSIPSMDSMKSNQENPKQPNQRRHHSPPGEQTSTTNTTSIVKQASNRRQMRSNLPAASTTKAHAEEEEESVAQALRKQRHSLFAKNPSTQPRKQRSSLPAPNDTSAAKGTTDDIRNHHQASKPSSALKIEAEILAQALRKKRASLSGRNTPSPPPPPPPPPKIEETANDNATQFPEKQPTSKNANNILRPTPLTAEHAMAQSLRNKRASLPARTDPPPPPPSQPQTQSRRKHRRSLPDRTEKDAASHPPPPPPPPPLQTETAPTESMTRTLRMQRSIRSAKLAPPPPPAKAEHGTTQKQRSDNLMARSDPRKAGAESKTQPTATRETEPGPPEAEEVISQHNQQPSSNSSSSSRLAQTLRKQGSTLSARSAPKPEDSKAKIVAAMLPALALTSTSRTDYDSLPGDSTFSPYRVDDDEQSDFSTLASSVQDEQSTFSVLSPANNHQRSARGSSRTTCSNVSTTKRETNVASAVNKPSLVRHTGSTSEESESTTVSQKHQLEARRRLLGTGALAVATDSMKEDSDSCMGGGGGKKGRLSLSNPEIKDDQIPSSGPLTTSVGTSTGHESNSEVVIDNNDSVPSTKPISKDRTKGGNVFPKQPIDTDSRRTDKSLLDLENGNTDSSNSGRDSQHTANTTSKDGSSENDEYTTSYSSRALSSKPVETTCIVAENAISSNAAQVGDKRPFAGSTRTVVDPPTSHGDTASEKVGNEPYLVGEVPDVDVFEKALEVQYHNVDFGREIAKLKSLSSEEVGAAAGINPDLSSALSKYIDLVNLKEKVIDDGTGTVETKSSGDGKSENQRLETIMSKDSEAEAAAQIDPKRFAEISEYIDVLRQKSNPSTDISMESKDDEPCIVFEGDVPHEELSKIEDFIKQRSAGTNDLLAYLTRQAAKNKNVNSYSSKSSAHGDPPNSSSLDPPMQRPSSSQNKDVHDFDPPMQRRSLSMAENLHDDPPTQSDKSVLADGSVQHEDPPMRCASIASKTDSSAVQEDPPTDFASETNGEASTPVSKREESVREKVLAVSNSKAMASKSAKKKRTGNAESQAETTADSFLEVLHRASSNTSTASLDSNKTKQAEGVCENESEKTQSEPLPMSNQEGRSLQSSTRKQNDVKSESKRAISWSPDSASPETARNQKPKISSQAKDVDDNDPKGAPVISTTEEQTVSRSSGPQAATQKQARRKSDLEPRRTTSIQQKTSPDALDSQSFVEKHSDDWSNLTDLTVQERAEFAIAALNWRSFDEDEEDRSFSFTDKYAAPATGPAVRENRMPKEKCKPPECPEKELFSHMMTKSPPTEEGYYPDKYCANSAPTPPTMMNAKPLDQEENQQELYAAESADSDPVSLAMMRSLTSEEESFCPDKYAAATTDFEQDQSETERHSQSSDSPECIRSHRDAPLAVVKSPVSEDDQNYPDKYTTVGPDIEIQQIEESIEVEDRGLPKFPEFNKETQESGTSVCPDFEIQQTEEESIEVDDRDLPSKFPELNKEEQESEDVCVSEPPSDSERETSQPSDGEQDKHDAELLSASDSRGNSQQSDSEVSHIIVNSANVALRHHRKNAKAPRIRTKFVDLNHTETAIELVGEVLSCEESASYGARRCGRLETATEEDYKLTAEECDEVYRQCTSPAEASVDMVRKLLSCEEGMSSGDDILLTERYISIPDGKVVEDGTQARTEKLVHEKEEVDVRRDDQDADAAAQGSQDVSTQLAESIRALYPLVTGMDAFSSDELVAFEKLVRYAFPFIDGKEPTAAQVSKILSRAKKLRISLDATDRFIEATTLLFRQTNSESAQHKENGAMLGSDIKLLSFLADLLDLIDSFSDDAENDDPVEILPVCAPHQITSEEEAVEIEVNDGFATKEDAIHAIEEPWWKVAARLNGSAVDEAEFMNLCDSRPSDSFALDSPCGARPNSKHENNVETEISQFWEEREQLQEENAISLRKTKSKSPRRHLKSNSESSHMSTSQHSHISSLTYSYEERVKEAWVKQRRKNSKIRRKLAHQQNAASFSEPINAVTSVSKMLPQRRNSSSKKGAKNFSSSSKSWRESYPERTKNHEGFIGIDVHSLYDSCSVGARSHSLDHLPWETRDVKQRFLHEQSVSLNRNWFGSLSDVSGNRKVRMPVCRPASMEMPMKAASWTEEWYRPKNPYRDLLKRDGDESDDDDDDDDASWEMEETPECGKIKNVKLKIGERITRVTPDLTSSLRQSRWRKKYFRNHFPY